MEEIKLDFNDLLIVPKDQSYISSRSEINHTYEGWLLPLFTAPMDTVISNENEHLFGRMGINIVMPRYVDTLSGFKSYSLDNMVAIVDGFNTLYENGNYLIDIANGHMDRLLSTVVRLKIKYPNIKLMVGNVANPETYRLLSEAGADYIRVGIGNGGGCLTTQNTGVGYPMASLISECYEISTTLKTPAKIVADGGMQSYSDIIKALGLGADYVMLGGILNKCIESAGDNYLWKWLKVPQWLAIKAYKNKIPVYKKFRGMSTKEVQKKWGAKKLKTSEGVVRFRKVEYTLDQWVENFIDYLKSAMSYSDASNLSEFIGYAKFVKISDNAYKRFNK